MVFGWFRKSNVPNKLLSNTEDSAIIIIADSPMTGIAQEYAELSRRFGEANKDWKIANRRNYRLGDDRTIEKFVISHKGKRYEIYFDISAWTSLSHRGKTPQAVMDALDRLKKRAEEDSLSIDLPNLCADFLFRMCMHLASDERLKDVINAELVENLRPAIELSTRMPDRDNYKITLKRAQWIKLRAVMNMLDLNLKDQEVCEDLKAYIDGSQARNGV